MTPSAFPESGHSDVAKIVNKKGSSRPEADAVQLFWHQYE